MKLIVVGNVYGHLDILNYYIEAFNCDAVLSTGNLGLFYPNETKHRTSPIYNGRVSDFRNYILGKKEFIKPVYAIRGRWDSYFLAENAEKKEWFIKNFKLMQNGEKITINVGNESVSISGLGGIYVPGKFNSGSKSYKYYNRSEYDQIISQNQDIVLLHDVMGHGDNKRIIFGDEVYELGIKVSPKFVFLGQYDYQVYCPEVAHTNFAICPGIGKGFYIVDTKDWSLFFIKQYSVQENYDSVDE